MDQDDRAFQTPPPDSRKAIAALVLGILSLCCSLVPLMGGIAGLLFAIVGLVLGIQARKEQNSNLSLAGFLVSLIALTLCIFNLVFCGVFPALLGMGI